MPVRDVVSRVVSHPRVFEIQTSLLGGHRLDEAIRPAALHATGGRPSGTVLDVGGGTASGHALWPEGWTYISVDPDRRVVEFDSSHGAIRRLVGDATMLPFPDDAIDVVFMKGVSHHLEDTTWSKALVEVRRILKPDGYFLFVDGVWRRRRVISRLAWTLDAGRFPRVPERLEAEIAESFEVESIRRLTLLHDSLILTGRPLPASRLANAAH
jgi:SAM-dependent methyltransferase